MEERNYSDKINAEALDPLRTEAFLRSLLRPREPFLEELREEAEKSGVPILRETTEGLLRFFLDLVKPKEILEVGTAVGYSALVMYRELGGNCHITTLENYPPRIEAARKNFQAAGIKQEKDSGIDLLTGDAGELLPTLRTPCDFIFMDAAKAQYVNWLPWVKSLMKKGAVLVSDNIFQEGDLLASRYGVTRRDRTIHKRMREYLNALKEDPDFETVVVPIGDGVAVTLKKA